MKFNCRSPLYDIVGTWHKHNISLKLTFWIKQQNTFTTIAAANDEAIAS